ncbi:MAG: hypothetical protein A3G20_05685 [Acidobacteria bacterium RIFCSPLOWO2_12_FULL_59_11]|nr:MAG: hypothetical protein A3G20_05685 [Acidobacteria bacterium RIFCSPLOWO2_12_FULL_59_11]
MRYARTFFLTVLWAVVGMSLTTTLYSQSLVELARQERAKKAQEGAVKVYTNEDVGSATSSPAAPAAAETQAPAAPTPGAAPQASGAAAPAGAQPSQTAEPKEKTPAELEKEYREKFAQLRDKLSYEEKKADVMQRELNLMQIQNYSDPNVAMREQYARTEINTRTQEIEAQKQAVEQAKQAIADLEEELRRKDLPPGWAR